MIHTTVHKSTQEEDKGVDTTQEKRTKTLPTALESIK